MECPDVAREVRPLPAHGPVGVDRGVRRAREVGDPGGSGTAPIPQLPLTSVVTPCGDLADRPAVAQERQVGVAVEVHPAGRHDAVRGIDAFGGRSRRKVADGDDPSRGTPTSARRRGAPVPSMTEPPDSTRSRPGTPITPLLPRACLDRQRRLADQALDRLAVVRPADLWAERCAPAWTIRFSRSAAHSGVSPRPRPRSIGPASRGHELLGDPLRLVRIRSQDELGAEHPFDDRRIAALVRGMRPEDLIPCGGTSPRHRTARTIARCRRSGGQLEPALLGVGADDDRDPSLDRLRALADLLELVLLASDR